MLRFVRRALDKNRNYDGIEYSHISQDAREGERVASISANVISSNYVNWMKHSASRGCCRAPKTPLAGLTSANSLSFVVTSSELAIVRGESRGKSARGAKNQFNRRAPYERRGEEVTGRPDVPATGAQSSHDSPFTGLAALRASPSRGFFCNQSVATP